MQQLALANQKEEVYVYKTKRKRFNYYWHFFGFVLCFKLNLQHAWRVSAITWFMTPVIASIVCATPFLILLAKVKKPFAIIISSTIIGLIYLITGQFHIAVTLVFIIGGIIGELIRRVSKYQSFKTDAIAYALVSLGMAASPLSLWIDT